MHEHPENAGLRRETLHWGRVHDAGVFKVTGSICRGQMKIFKSTWLGLRAEKNDLDDDFVGVGENPGLCGDRVDQEWRIMVQTRSLGPFSE